MLTFGVFISFLVYSVSGAGQLVILNAPPSVSFSGNDVIDSHVIPKVFAASLGFTTEQTSNWLGVNFKDPFNFAKALVVVAVDGVSTLGEFGNLPTFPIDPTEEEVLAWRFIEENVRERVPGADESSLLRVELGQGNHNIDAIKTTFLNKLNDDDADLLQDVAQLTTFIDKYQKDGFSKQSPVVNWFTLSSLHTLSDVKGSTDDATLEAKGMVRDTLLKLGKVVNEATGGRALVAAIITDGSHTRHERAAGPEAAPNNTAPTNRATIYTEDYPVIFNIILWFSVAFIFSLIAVSYFIADMDPGRDSIIYRMTSNRMKKDS